MKKTTILKTILLSLFLITVEYGYSQGDFFSISGQYRMRTEFRDGYRTLMPDTLNPAFFVGQRARLLFDFKKDNISSKVSIQDARTWGDEEQRKDLAGLQVNELWVELGLKKGFSVKLGRQELVYDDHRILGNLDWANLTISHDALLLKYANAEKKMSWHLGSAYNQVGEPLSGTAYGLKNYTYLVFTHFKAEIPNINSTVSVLGVANGMNSAVATSKSVKTSYTFGALYNFKQNSWKANLGAYYQAGKTDTNLNISAYMVNLFGGYFKEKYSVGLGIDYLSGNNDKTAADKYGTFNTLYATNHKFYGFMDYFLNIPADSKSRGLIDGYTKITAGPFKKLSPALDLHYFALANENNTGLNKIKKGLGAELDFILEYVPSSLINLQVGYSMMFASQNMEYIKGGNKDRYNGWAFVMLKVTPVFFKHEFAPK